MVARKQAASLYTHDVMQTMGCQISDRIISTVRMRLLSHGKIRVASGAAARIVASGAISLAPPPPLMDTDEADIYQY